MNSYNNDNIRILNGTTIKRPSDHDIDEWHFTVFTFSKDEIINGMKTPSKSDIKENIEDKQAFVWVHSFKQVKFDGKEQRRYNNCINSDNPDIFLSPQSLYDRLYANLPTCVLLPNGSLVPHPIPDPMGEIGGQVITYQVDEDPLKFIDEWPSQHVCIYCTADNDEFTASYIKTRNISYTMNDDKFQVGFGDELDYRKIQNGAFQFGYNITEFTQPKVASDPIPYFMLTCNTQNLGENEDGSPQTDTSETNYMQLKIPADQKSPVSLYYNGNSKEYALKTPDSSLLPNFPLESENIKRDKLHYLFVFSTYYGILVTNDLSASVFDRNNCFVVKSNKPSVSPFNNLGITNITATEALTRYLKRSSNASALEVFPACAREGKDPEKMRLKLKHRKELVFGNIKDVKTTMFRSAGYTSYYPIFFCRALSFTVFFKGLYAVNGDQSIIEYYAYPIVNCYADLEYSYEMWSGISRKGAKCIKAKLAYVDKSKQEAVYYIDVQFIAKYVQRYPIECFGIVIAGRLKKRNIKISNGNGSFLLGKTESSGYIRTKYPAARRSQTSQSLNYFGIMKQLSVNAGLDGVAGQMTLDGYPLQQGIAKLIQDQYVGEVDLKVSISPSSNNPNPDIFKGLEASTSNSSGSYNISVELKGSNLKLSDMKIVNCPFWDGDLLEEICEYVEDYAKIPLKMANYTVTKLKEAISTGHSWKAKKGYSSVNSNEDFRVPRSTNFESPAIAYPNGVSCFDLLKDLAQATGCIFCVGLDGF